VRLRPEKKPKPQPDAGFDWREVVCADEEAAKAEAERRQALDDAGEAEWIYLRSDRTGQWLARRTPRHLECKPAWYQQIPHLPPGP